MAKQWEQTAEGRELLEKYNRVMLGVTAGLLSVDAYNLAFTSRGISNVIDESTDGNKVKNAIDELLILNDDFYEYLISDFPKLAEKYGGLAEESRLLFKSDFGANSVILSRFNTEELSVKAWSDLATIGKKVDGVPQGHALKTNVDFLKKYDALDDARKTKLKGYLDEQKAFTGKKGEVSYSASRTIDIGDGNAKVYNVDYDEFGFPKFEQYCPDGFNANQSDLTSYFSSGKTKLDGGSNDFTAANNWLKNEFPDKDITKTSTGFKLKENGVENRIYLASSSKRKRYFSSTKSNT